MEKRSSNNIDKSNTTVNIDKVQAEDRSDILIVADSPSITISNLKSGHALNITAVDSKAPTETIDATAKLLQTSYSLINSSSDSKQVGLSAVNVNAVNSQVSIKLESRCDTSSQAYISTENKTHLDSSGNVESQQVKINPDSHHSYPAVLTGIPGNKFNISLFHNQNSLPDEFFNFRTKSIKHDYSKIFIEHEEIFTFMKQRLEKNKIVFLIGPNGIGKTQTAIQYTKQENYHYILKVRANSLDTFLYDYIGMYNKNYKTQLPITHEPIQLINQNLNESLRISRKKLLLIIDNVNDYKILSYLPDCNENINIIITSNLECNEKNIAKKNIKKLSSLNSLEAEILLMKLWGLTDEEFSEIKKGKCFAAFLQQTGTTPLFLIFIGFYIKKRAKLGTSYVNAIQNFLYEANIYFKSLDKCKLSYSYLTLNDNYSENDQQSFYSNIYFCISQIAFDNDIAVNIIKLLALLGHSNFSSEFLKEYAGHGAKEILYNLAFKSLILIDINNKIEIQPLISTILFNYVGNNYSQLKIIDAINFILNNNNLLLELDIESKLILLIKIKKFSHININLNNFNDNAKKSFIDITEEILVYYSQIEYWSKFYPFFNKIEKYLIQLEKNYQNISDDFYLLKSQLYLTVAWYGLKAYQEERTSIKRSKSSIDYAKEALAIKEKYSNYIKNKDDILNTKNTLAVLLIAHKYYDEAEKLLMEILNILSTKEENDLLTEESEQFRLAKTYDSIGLLHKRKGNYNESLANYSNAIYIYNKYSEDNDLKVKQYRSYRTACYVETAKTYLECLRINDFKDNHIRNGWMMVVENLLHSALNLYKEQWKSNSSSRYCYPDSIYQCYNNLISVYLMQERKKEAEKVLNECLHYVKEYADYSGNMLFLQTKCKNLDERRLKIAAITDITETSFNKITFGI